MKCGTEKFFAPLLLAAVLTVTGCAPITPRDRVADALDDDGEVHFISESTALIREGSVWFGDIERRVAESESPRRDAVQAYLTMLKMLCRFSGAGTVEAVGMSSRREPDGSYLNRCAAAGRTGSAWPWNLGGVQEDHLHDLRNFPGDVIAAASFTVDAEAAAEELRASGATALLEYKNPILLGFSIREALANASGKWQAAILPPPSGRGADWTQCGFSFSVPDRGGALFNRLSAFLPPAGNGALRLPTGGAISPLVVGGDGRIRVYSTPECRAGITSPRHTLGGATFFAAAAAKLPAAVHGAFYFSADGDTDLGVWRFTPGMLDLSAYSTRGAAVHALRRLLLAPLSLAITQALDRPAPQRETAAMRTATERSTALPPPELLKKRRDTLVEVRDYLNAQRKLAGKFPAELPGKYSALVCFGAMQSEKTGKLPLISEAPDPHRPGIGVLFADGTIEFFSYPAASLKHLCSFLHTRYRYDEKDFVRLIRRASELDAQKKGTRP